MKQSKSSKGIVITSIICCAVVIVSVVGGLVYMQHQNSIQKAKEFQQQKQLKEYEQDQINQRNKADNEAKERAAKASNPNCTNWFSC